MNAYTVSPPPNLPTCTYMCTHTHTHTCMRTHIHTQSSLLTSDNITHVGQRSVVVVVAVAWDAVFVVAVVAVGTHVADVACVACFTLCTLQEPLFCNARNQDIT